MDFKVTEGPDQIAWQMLTERLEFALFELFYQQKAEMSEYELIQKLSQSPYDIFSPEALKKHLDLFQTHFVLFHSLYKLRDDWWQQYEEWLDISPLKIKLTPTHENESGKNNSSCSSEHQLATSDPIAHYYLNLSHLFTTSEKNVDAMLNRFWTEYLNPCQKHQALNILGCQLQDTPETIKKNYRRLVMQHHPDRGGNKAEFNRIQEAYSILKLYFY